MNDFKIIGDGEMDVVGVPGTASSNTGGPRESAAIREAFQAGWWFNTGASAVGEGFSDPELEAWEERDWREWCEFKTAAAAASLVADGAQVASTTEAGQVPGTEA